MDDEICDLCGKPLLAGQAIHGLRRQHFDCYELKNGSYADPMKELNDAAERMEAALNKLKRSLS